MVVSAFQNLFFSFFLSLCTYHTGKRARQHDGLIDIYCKMTITEGSVNLHLLQTQIKKMEESRVRKSNDEKYLMLFYCFEMQIPWCLLKWKAKHFQIPFQGGN